MEVRYDTHGFPKSIFDWRKEPRKTWGTNRHVWNPLEDFFEQNGYTLFITNKENNCCLVPKIVDEKRAPDQYHHVLPEDRRQYKCRSVHYTNKLCPATRKKDGVHVAIQLVCKAGQGQGELDILRYFSQPGIKEDPANHVLPLIDELHCLDMSFAVVPLLYHAPCNYPWFLNLTEALDAIYQSFEALAFVHKHLVAHRDIGSGEFLYNFGGSTRGPQYLAARLDRGPLRSLFPCRYYIIDFETAIQFDKTSLPADRVVTGMATLANHGTEDFARYGKAFPPEWTTGEPYCPFASDVYQIAGMWKALFWVGEACLPNTDHFRSIS
ncbi:hypothetical protein P389DRAFT_174558 [Cystobasidium minutum MCA 4210]|uniref:uncharacterized protein n=1 Tax=Cystobasidium minutum MCA 4210 TaxID=1397322 RepID=UPI0034CD1A62|eukprot:jgi/Rhomi1/174558/fgenesh1_kg.8_\